VAEVKPVEKVDVACEAPDLELLFVAWLNALIYEDVRAQDVVLSLLGRN